MLFERSYIKDGVSILRLSTVNYGDNDADRGCECAVPVHAGGGGAEIGGDMTEWIATLVEVLCSRCGALIGHIEVRADEENNHVDWSGCHILATTTHCYEPPGSKY